MKSSRQPPLLSKFRVVPVILPLLISLATLSNVRADVFDDLWKQYIQQTEQAASQKYESTISRRERNLDHWDVPTAAAYLGLHPETLKPLPQYADQESSSVTALTSSQAESQPELVDEYIGHDAAILFYAQWCRNCHAVAPSWDAIATYLQAGSRSSNLVLALFDCEKNARHMELCGAAGVKAYPTIMFVGSGEYHDTDVVTRTILGKDRSAGPMGATTLPRTVKFQGNWQYGDQLLDWVNIMRGLSSWHKMSESGPLRGLRSGIFGLLTGGKFRGRNNAAAAGKKGALGGSLPVGIPPGFQTELRGTGGVSGTPSAANQEEINKLELRLNATKKENDSYEKAVMHSSLLLDGLLFHGIDNKGNATKAQDPFALLTQTDGWYANITALPTNSSNDEHPTIVRSCAVELTIDYCNRVTTRVTNAYIEELNNILEEDPFPSLEDIEKNLIDGVTNQEPYCSLVENCLLTNFETKECRPEKCPFKNEAACHYLEACFDPSVQNEYGLALELISEGETVLDKDWNVLSEMDKKEGKVKPETNAKEEKKSVGGWGIPVPN